MDKKDAHFPYIVSRINKVESKSLHESIVTMMIFFGIFAEAEYDEKGAFINDGNGYRDFWNLVEETRQALFKQPTLDKKFRIIADFFDAEMLEEQVYPYWEGFCKTKWKDNAALAVRQLSKAKGQDSANYKTLENYLIIELSEIVKDHLINKKIDMLGESISQKVTKTVGKYVLLVFVGK